MNIARTIVTADIVLVGAGSAGCAVAGRLAEQGRDVLLLEKGPDYGPMGSGRWPAELLSARVLAARWAPARWGCATSAV